MKRELQKVSTKQGFHLSRLRFCLLNFCQHTDFLPWNVSRQHQDGVDIVTAECEVEEGKEKQEEEQEKADSACEGSLTFDTGDYFRGEFQGGSLRNRYNQHHMLPLIK